MRGGGADYSKLSLNAKNRKGFTLAEVLITLAVVGIVATLTISNLVQSYKKRVIETKLIKFYSMMQEVVRLSEIENGNKKFWTIRSEDFTVEDFYNTYMAKYMKVDKVDVRSDNGIRIYFPDGTGIVMHSSSPTSTSMSANFLPDASKFDLPSRQTGRDDFLFYFAPAVQDTRNFCSGISPHFLMQGKGWEPYLWIGEKWNNELSCLEVNIPDNDADFREMLMNKPTYGCAQSSGLYCLELIRRNGWKIPDDYPVKF